jgi:hypothetical protein
MNYRLFIILGCSFLVGCSVNHRHEQFTTGIIGPALAVHGVEIYLNLHPSVVNGFKTKGSGPWLFSFEASTRNKEYSKLVIESAVFTDLKNNQVTLIEPHALVEMTFSSEREPVGEFAVNYYSVDREPLQFDFFESQKLELQLRFFLINAKNEKEYFNKKVTFKAKLIEGRAKFNILTDVT